MAMLMHSFLPSDSQTGYPELVPSGLGRANGSSTMLRDDISPPLLGEELVKESTEDLYHLLQGADYGYPTLPGPSTLPAAPTAGLPSLLDDLFTPSSDLNDLLWESPHAYGTPVSDSSSPFSSNPSSPFSSPILSPEEAISGIVSSLKNSVEFQFSPNECLPYTPQVETLLCSADPISPSSSVPLSSPTPSYSLPSHPTSPMDSPLSSTSTSRKRQRQEDSDPSHTVQPKQRTRMARKERKREQNKTAAIRYRQKKKEEADSLLLKQQKLEKKNRQLHRHVDGLLSEINYLKKLWQEVSAARQHRK